MSLWIWVSLAICLAGLYSIFRFYGLWILETTTSRALETFNSGVLRQGLSIKGPKWQFPNGSVFDRFVNGRVSSEKWREYGPVYRIWTGHHPEIVITTPEDLKIFTSDSNDHGKEPNVNMGWFLGEVLGQALGLLYGKDWKRLRQIFNPPFTHAAAVVQLDIIERTAKKYVEELHLLAENPSANTGEKELPKSFELAVVKAFTKYFYFLTARAIYGTMTEIEEGDLWDVTQKRLALNPYIFGGGPYRSKTAARLFDSAAVQKLREYNTEWRDYNIRMVQDRLVRNEKTPVVSYWEEHEKGNMNMEEFLQTLDELLILNLDVFIHVVTWLITLVADHEEVKRELREEITANKDSLLDYISKTDTYLHRCFYESMRVRPFTVFTIGECSPSVKNFRGILVKPNTQVLIDIQGINVRNSFWGSNSEAFDPSRFKTIKQSDLRYNFHVWGFGNRKCMGQYVAGHIAKALMIHLFQEYEVVVSKGSKDSDTYNTDNSSWTPKADSLLRLTKR